MLEVKLLQSSSDMMSLVSHSAHNINSPTSFIVQPQWHASIEALSTVVVGTCSRPKQPKRFVNSEGDCGGNIFEGASRLCLHRLEGGTTGRRGGGPLPSIGSLCLRYGLRIQVCPLACSSIISSCMLTSVLTLLLLLLLLLLVVVVVGWGVVVWLRLGNR